MSGTMWRRAAGALVCAALLPLSAAAARRAAGPEALRVRLPKPYPLEIVARRHVALFHWVDSLAGTSGGKTIRAHQLEYKERFGRITFTEQDTLRRFRQARERDSRRHLDPPQMGLTWLRHIFLSSPDLETALARAREGMAEEDYRALVEALEYFGRKYDEIWRNGETLRAFLERVDEDPLRFRLSKLLQRMAGAFGVPEDLPRPQVDVVPVPSGYGTHATAVGSYLLIEVRPVDVLADQASVIVHETAHYFMEHMDSQVSARVKALVEAGDARAQQAWNRLGEALPTALGQGAADSIFREQAWSRDRSWYHIAEVDAYAKAIYPLVERVMHRKKGRFDAAFFEEALRLYPG